MPTKLFIGNLPEDCAKDTIRDVFGSYGNIEDIAVVKNYAFVHFSNEGDASKAVKDLDGSKIGGKTINVQVSKKQDNDSRGRRDNRDNRDNRDRGRGDRYDSRGAPARGRNGPDRGPLVGILGARPGGLGGFGGPGLGGLIAPGLGGLGAPGLGGIPGLAGLGLGGLGALGGAAGAPLGGLGILSAVKTLAAVAEKQQLLNTAQQQQQQQQHQSSQQQSFQDREQQQQQQQQQQRERDQPDPDVRVRREVVHTQDVPNAASMGLNNGYVIYERYYVDPTHPLLKGLPLPELPRMPDNTNARDNSRNEITRSNNLSRDASRSDLYSTSDNFRSRSPHRENNNDRSWNPVNY